MKRTLATLVLGLATVGFVGCGQEAGTETSTTTTAPDGSQTTVTSENKVETTGDNPPAPGAPTTPATGTEAPK